MVKVYFVPITFFFNILSIVILNSLSAKSNIYITCELASSVLFCQSHHLAYLVIFDWLSDIV